MRKEEILKALREAGTPITIDELSQKTGIDTVRLRVDLFMLTGEGKVERKRSGNVTTWAIKVTPPAEQRPGELYKQQVP